MYDYSNFLTVFLRKCPSSEHRKKIKNILRKAKKVKKAKEVGQSTVVAGVDDGATALDDNAKALDNNDQALEESAKALDINASTEAPNSDASPVDANTKALEDNTKTLDNTTTKGPEKDAKTICWFCHADVSNMKNCICAGCKKVSKTLSLVNKSSLIMVQNLHWKPEKREQEMSK